MEKKFCAGSLNALNAAMNNVEDALQQTTAEVAPVQPVVEPAAPVEEKVTEGTEGKAVEEPMAPSAEEAAPKKRASRKKVEQLIGMNVQIPKSVYMKLQSIRVDRRISGRQLALELMELGLKHYDPKEHE